MAGDIRLGCGKTKDTFADSTRRIYSFEGCLVGGRGDMSVKDRRSRSDAAICAADRIQGSAREEVVDKVQMVRDAEGEYHPCL